MLQIIVKLLISIVVFVPVALGLFWLWRQDIDVSKTFARKRLVEAVTNAPSKLVVVREPTSLYQRGNNVGVALSAKVDESAKTVLFEEITNSGSLNLGEQFEYRSYVLRFDHADTMIGLSSAAPEKGRIVLNCTCSIIGRR